MFNDISCGTKRQWTTMSGTRSSRIFVCKEVWYRTMVIHWSWFWEKVVFCERRQSTRNLGQIGGKDRCWRNSQRADVRFSVLRLHCPEVNSEAKDMVNCRFTLQPFRKQLRLFRIIVSANQLSFYGAVAEMCEEYESHHDRSVRLDKVMGQSIVLRAIKEVLLDCDDPTNQDLLLQQYGERIEKLSQQDKVSKFCMDAGFLSVVEIGQYFMTKDNGEQFYAMACREYTLPRDDEASQPRGWIQGSTKIVPVLEVTTSCLHGEHGVEIRIWSLSWDSTHSWVRISHGSNKFVMDSNNNDRNSWRSGRRTSVTTGCKRFCMPSKGKSKTTKNRTCWLFTKNRSHWKEGLDRVIHRKYIEKKMVRFICGE